MNKGFFFDEEVVKKQIKKTGRKKIQSEKDLCEKCGLYKDCLNPKMKYTGKGEKEILIIGDRPGKKEDKQNSQFVGKEGLFLRKKFRELNISFEKDCWKTYACICSTSEKLTVAQINYCRHNLKKVIQELKPKKILTFGATALQSLIGDKMSATNINQWVGFVIPDQEYQCNIFPNFDLDEVLKNSKNVILNKKFNDYLEQSLLKNPKFKKYDDYQNDIAFIFEEKKAIDFLKSIKKGDCIVFDYETTGIKPQKKGHEIVCLSICKNKKTYSFPFFQSNENELKRIFEDEDIKLIAHNIQFENRWTYEILKSKIKGWVFDTQTSTHVLDNRRSITGLKFQIYANFGICGYENDAKKYIQSIDGSANGFNRMKEFLQEQPEKCLLYCGIDSHFTYMLYKKHLKKLDDHLKKGHNFFLESNTVLSSLYGIRFDKELYDKTKKEITFEINEIHKKIMNSEEVQSLDNPDEFNYDSSLQLSYLLYDNCKWKTKNKTKTGKNSVSAETLKEFDQKLTNNILKIRKLRKIRDTYLSQFEREAIKLDDGHHYIFPNFPLNFPVSYRSSSRNPNFQNIPVREKQAKKIVRNLIIPRKDRILLEVDGKAMEVGTSCCYHEDPTMIDYVANKGDMHADLAKQLFFRSSTTYTKFERYIAKNKFVFPSFYGSTARIFSPQHKKQKYGDVTEGIWFSIDENTKNHLKNNNIKNIFDMQKHIENIESHFWNERFPVYQNWKWENWKKYKQNGYIELKTGFRCTNIMSFNDANNYPIQGTAYHIMQKVLNKTEYYLRSNNIDAYLIAEIHDSGLFDINPKDLDLVIKIFMDNVSEVRKEWDWINVPLTIEAEITGVNESWAEKKEIAI